MMVIPDVAAVPKTCGEDEGRREAIDRVLCIIILSTLDYYV